MIYLGFQLIYKYFRLNAGDRGRVGLRGLKGVKGKCADALSGIQPTYSISDISINQKIIFSIKVTLADPEHQDRLDWMVHKVPTDCLAREVSMVAPVSRENPVCQDSTEPKVTREN